MPGRILERLLGIGTTEKNAKIMLACQRLVNGGKISVRPHFSVSLVVPKIELDPFKDKGQPLTEWEMRASISIWIQYKFSHWSHQSSWLTVQVETNRIRHFYSYTVLWVSRMKILQIHAYTHRISRQQHSPILLWLICSLLFNLDSLLLRVNLFTEWGTNLQMKKYDDQENGGPFTRSSIVVFKRQRLRTVSEPDKSMMFPNLAVVQIQDYCLWHYVWRIKVCQDGLTIDCKTQGSRLKSGEPSTTWIRQFTIASPQMDRRNLGNAISIKLPS